MKFLFSFLTAIPDLIKLYKAIERYRAEQKAKEQVKNDVKEITDAFNSGDASKLNRVFASRKDTDEV